MRNSLFQDSIEKEKILFQLLQKERGYYAVVLELAKTEKEKLTQQRPFNELSQVLRKKQIIIACIEEIEEDLQPLKSFWLEYKQGSHNINKEIEDLLKKLSYLVEEILVIDQENQTLLSVYMQSLKLALERKKKTSTN